jgi:hypothetical protein
MSKMAPASREAEIVAVLKTAEQERDWLAQHPEVLAPYRGQWVLVHDHRVVAHSADGLEVARLAPTSEYPGAVFEYIPTIEEREAIRVL